MTCRFPLLAAIALAGCAAGVGVPPPQPTGQQFDGSYMGENKLIRGFGGYVCAPPEHPQQISINGGRFDYPFQYQPSVILQVPVTVAADGSFSGRLQYFSDYPYSRWADGHLEWVFVSGRIAGPTLDATVISPRCTNQIVAQRN